MDLAFGGRMLAGLAVIVVVLYGLQIVARAGWRSRLTGGDRRLMSVVESLALPNAASLHVVKIADRYFVFGRSTNHIANLCEISAENVDTWIAAQAAAPAPAAAPLTWIQSRLGGRRA